MLGIIFIIFGTLFSEISDSIGKKEVIEKKENTYTMGFLNYFWGTVILIGWGFFKNSFVFSLSSLPTFLPRVLLEIFLAHITIMAICRADRSTFGFIRILTIPPASGRYYLGLQNKIYSNNRVGINHLGSFDLLFEKGFK